MATKTFDVNHDVKALKIKDGTALIVSVDGTLADTSEAQAGDMNTTSYRCTVIGLEAVDRVQVNEGVAKRVRSYVKNNYPILYLTWRPKDLRTRTEEWLKKNDLWSPKCFVLARENYDTRERHMLLKAAVTFARKYIGVAYESDNEMIKFYNDLNIEVKRIGVEHG